MGLNGMEALEIEHRLDEPGACRIAVEGGDDVGAECLAQLGLVVQRVSVGLSNQFRGYVGVVEPFADAMHDRRFQRVVMQDRGIDEGADFRLAPDDVFGFFTNAPPGRIDLLNCALRLALVLRHRRLGAFRIAVLSQVVVQQARRNHRSQVT
jgi:hypothetical protein